MKNYLDEIYTVSKFKRDHLALAEMAERALNYLKRYPIVRTRHLSSSKSKATNASPILRTSSVPIHSEK